MSIKWPHLWTVLVLCIPCMGAEESPTFSIPGSLLLFGNYNELRVVTSEKSEVLHPPAAVGYNGGYFANPSIAARGDLIAWGFATTWQQNRPRNKARFALGVYSLADARWKTYGDFDDIGDAGISSDGSKVAFVVWQNDRPSLRLLDVATESLNEGTSPQGILERGTPSWSPDRTQLAIQVEGPDKTKSVAVLDLKTRNLALLGEGFHPQWSPDGEWIAYYVARKCMLIHPDGTGLKTAMDLKDSRKSSRNFGWGSPVWSPDSRQLLLNVTKDGGPLLDVVLLDLASGQTTTKSTSGLPVFGWVRDSRKK